MPIGLTVEEQTRALDLSAPPDALGTHYGPPRRSLPHRRPRVRRSREGRQGFEPPCRSWRRRPSPEDGSVEATAPRGGCCPGRYPLSPAQLGQPPSRVSPRRLRRSPGPSPTHASLRRTPSPRRGTAPGGGRILGGCPGSRRQRPHRRAAGGARGGMRVPRVCPCPGPTRKRRSPRLDAEPHQLPRPVVEHGVGFPAGHRVSEHTE